MILEACINLGGFENLKIRSDNFTSLKECATQIIKELSPLVNYQIEEFLRDYLIPLVYDPQRRISEIKHKQILKSVTNISPIFNRGDFDENDF